MIAKLAWAQFAPADRGYLLYFCALALTAALIFSATGMLFCRAVLAAGAALDGFFETIAFLTALVALVSGAVLAHANLFFLRLRQREFGVYLALGMTRKDLRNLFLTETLLLFALSLVLGGGAGFLLFQGFLALLSHMAALPQGLSAYPVEGASPCGAPACRCVPVFLCVQPAGAAAGTDRRPSAAAARAAGQKRMRLSGRLRRRFFALWAWQPATSPAKERCAVLCCRAKTAPALRGACCLRQLFSSVLRRRWPKALWGCCSNAGAFATKPAGVHAAAAQRAAARQCPRLRGSSR